MRPSAAGAGDQPFLAATRRRIISDAGTNPGDRRFEMEPPDGIVARHSTMRETLRGGHVEGAADVNADRPQSARCLALAAAMLLVPMTGSAQEGEWSVVGGGLVGPLADGKGVVKALEIFDDRLIVAGLLSRAGSTDVGNVAAWDGEHWNALGGGTDRPVDALAIFDGTLILGGSFARAGDIDVARIAAFDGDSWAPLGTGTDGWVASLHVHGDRLIAGGQFFTAGGDSARRVAAWDGTSWSPLGEGVGARPSPRRRGRVAVEEVVYAFSTFDGDLIAGGTFTAAGDKPLQNIARWSGERWDPLGAGLDGEVRALVEYRGRLLAGGKFRKSGEVTVNHIAAWDGVSWHPLEGRLSSEPGLGRWALAMDARGAELLVGGCFVKIGDEDAEFLARWEGSSWRPVMTGLDHCVNAIVSWNDGTYLGGSFTRAGLGRARYLVRWEE